MSKWDEYNQKMQGRPERALFQRAMKELRKPGVALDLGCGSGTETAALVTEGWFVHAYDAEISALDATAALVRNPSKIELHHETFEDLNDLPEADFIFAHHSLPFTKRIAFDAFLDLVLSSLKKGGLFAGTFFGPSDAWVKAGHVSGISKEELDKDFTDFEMIHFAEVDKVGPTALEGPKHWHVFEVVARKK